MPSRREVWQELSTAVIPLRHLSVVLGAQQADVREAVASSHGEGVTVVELEPSPLGAAAALLVDEAASACVPVAHRAAHRGGDVARRAGDVRIRETRTGNRRLAEASRLEPFELLADGALDDRGEVAVGDFGAHECPEPLELVAQLDTGGELDLEACGRKGLDDRLNSSRDEFSVRGCRCVSLDSWRNEVGGEWRLLLVRHRRSARSLRKLADGSRDVRPRRELGYERFDLARRQVRGSGEERLAVRRSQERYEPREAAQVDPPVSQGLEDCRVLASGACNGDAAVGLGLREVQVLGAVRKHRRECSSGIEPSLVDLAEMGDEIGLDAVRLRDELSETA